MYGELVVADIKIQLQMITPVPVLVRDILHRCAQELNSKLNTGILRNSLKKRVQEILQMNIMNQPEYLSLSEGGKLRTELGLVDAQTKIDSILRILIRGINVVNTPINVVGNQISGRIMITAVPGDFSDVLSSNAAAYTTEKGDIIPWLSWLLTMGDTIIIATHKVTYEPRLAAFSRTGYDVMLPSATGWKVPSEFSGTIDDNFITRAVMDSLPEVGQALEIEIRNKL